MALTEETVEDKIEVVGDFKIVQIREATIIKRDGVEISRSFKRKSLTPMEKVYEVRDPDNYENIITPASFAETDISGQSAEVQAICNAVWTDAVKTAYQTAMDASEI